MADKRAEARRRRILENPSERLQKLKDIKIVEDCNENQDSQCSITNNQSSDHDINYTDGEYMNKITDGDIDVNNDIHKDTSENDYFCADKSSTIDDDISADKETSTKEDDKPSWIMRKYRLLLFILLGWGVYMVVVKEFDFILAYLIGQRLPNELLPTLILTTFVAVELQVLVVSIIFTQKSPETKSQSMFALALTFFGIPRNILKFIGNITSMFMSIFTDLCVYIFVIVILKTLDEKV